MKGKRCYLYKSKYSDEIVGRTYVYRNLGYDQENKCYKGLTKNYDSEYLITIEDENNKCYAYIVDKEEALKEIIKSNKGELLKTYKFKELLDSLNSYLESK
jgi:hypothetical protein